MDVSRSPSTWRCCSARPSASPARSCWPGAPGWGVLPAGVQTRHVWGPALLGGIAFTVSPFVADLAYTDAVFTEQAKVGIFVRSLLSALLGVAVLRSGRRLSRRERDLVDG